MGHLGLLVCGFPAAEQEREWQEASVVQWAHSTDQLGLVLQGAIMLGIIGHMLQDRSRLLSTWGDVNRLILAICYPLSWACALLW
jgi:hypothetical protein